MYDIECYDVLLTKTPVTLVPMDVCFPKYIFTDS